MSKKKYKIIAKVQKGGFETWCYVTYHCDDLLSLTSFLDKGFTKWAWFNVFDRASRQQLANFTTHNRPHKKTL